MFKVKDVMRKILHNYLEILQVCSIPTSAGGILIVFDDVLIIRLSSIMAL